jgi:hypothetical protein
MRHTFASNAIAAGIATFEIARVMGTSVVQIEKTYGHLLPDAIGLRSTPGRPGQRPPSKRRHLMKRYLSRTPKKDYPEGVRIVHNFYPGPFDSDPGRDRALGMDGFRAWVTDEEGKPGWGERCYCGWLGGLEHYGTVGYIDAEGAGWWRGKKVHSPE